MDMVINAEDPNEEKQRTRQANRPMVLKDVVPGGDAGCLDPLNIDFSDRLERLGRLMKIIKERQIELVYHLRPQGQEVIHLCC